MKLFREELKKMLHIEEYRQKTTIFDREAFINLKGNRIAKVDFVTGSSSNRYTGLRVRIIHRVYGTIDQTVFLFCDHEPVNGKDLFIYEANRYNDDVWWQSQRQPSKDCYNNLSQHINQYLALFDMPNEP